MGYDTVTKGRQSPLVTWVIFLVDIATACTSHILTYLLLFSNDVTFSKQTQYLMLPCLDTLHTPWHLAVHWSCFPSSVRSDLWSQKSSAKTGGNIHNSLEAVHDLMYVYLYAQVAHLPPFILSLSMSSYQTSGSCSMFSWWDSACSNVPCLLSKLQEHDGHFSLDLASLMENWEYNNV